jgi:hypothetical protein
MTRHLNGKFWDNHLTDYEKGLLPHQVKASRDKAIQHQLDYEIYLFQMAKHQCDTRIEKLLGVQQDDN